MALTAPIGHQGGGVLLGLRSGFAGLLGHQSDATYLGGENRDWLAKLDFPMLGGGLFRAAYAIPGSPLPRWFRELRSRFSKPSPTAAAPPAASPAPSGITVPLEPRITIRFELPQPSGEVRVRIVEEASVSVRAVNGAATFATGPGTLTIGNRGSVADYEIDLPRVAPWIAITVGTRTLLLKRGTLVSGIAPPDPDGGYRLMLTDRP
jgi:hypothetical protein